MVARAPVKLTGEVRAFCRSIALDTEPAFVTVSPDLGAASKDCFNNVSEKVRREGGALIHGWAIWVWPRVLIEGEFHCIWQSPDKRLLDPTPKQNGSKHILFLPDPARRYDFATHRRIDNVRKALVNDPLIRKFFRSCEEIFKFEERNSVGLEIKLSPVETGTYQHLHAQKDAMFLSVVEKYLKRNDYCFCGSGRKFKKCCLHRPSNRA